MNKDLISIVVPVYGVEGYLDRCITSILMQTYCNFELILVDDGSRDASGRICDEYAMNDSRIIVIHKKNGGLSDARNAGIDISKGKYITFIDSDDYVENDYLEVLHKAIKKNNSDISICSYQSVYENGKILKQNENYCKVLSPEEMCEEILYQTNFNVSAWAKMYKIELFSNIRYPVGKIFEDAFTTYKLILKSKSISVDLKICYNYMIRGESILTSSFSEKKLTLIDAYDEMGKEILKKYPNLKMAVNRSKLYANISTLRQMIFIDERLIKKEKVIQKYIRKNYKYILYNKKSSFRDKIAVILISINIDLFKKCWLIYCKKTGRMYN